MSLGLTPANTWALFSYLETWSSPWIVDNCGDRLARILRAGRSVELPVTPEAETAISDDLTPRELFGLEPGFTRRELNAARRRLAAKFHPDQWQNASPAQREAAEAAMKRVNATFDELRGTAI